MELVYDTHANLEEMSAKVNIDSSVSDDYSHIVKTVVPGEQMSIGDTRVKWYSIAPADSEIPRAIELQAKNFLENISQKQTLDLGAVGFVILHRCGDEFYFLLLQTWKNNNELWESVYARHSDDRPEFVDLTFEGTHRGTFCVWEMAVVTYEMQAWKKFLVSSRKTADVAGYFENYFSGEC